MSNEQFDREQRYQAAMAVARRMLEQEVISPKDYAKIQTEFIAKYCPVFAGLYAHESLPFHNEKG